MPHRLWLRLTALNTDTTRRRLRLVTQAQKLLAHSFRQRWTLLALHRLPLAYSAQRNVPILSASIRASHLVPFPGACIGSESLPPLPGLRG